MQVAEASTPVYVDPHTREVYQTPSLESVTSRDVGAIRDTVDLRYKVDPIGYVNRMYEGLDTAYSGNLDFAVFHDDRVAKTDEMGILFAPLNDCPPQSSPQDFIDYLRNPNPSKADRRKAQPNSWRQLMKAADVYETLVAAGEGMPIAVAFSPLSRNLFTEMEARDLLAGVATPYGKVARAMIGKVGSLVHGYGSERFSKFHLFAPGLGHMAIGAALDLRTQLNYDILSVTTPNLILGQKNQLTLFNGYTLGQYRGEPEEIEIQTSKIGESPISQNADKAGSEFAMNKRMVSAMFNKLHLRAMYLSDWSGLAIQNLAKDGTTFTISSAANATLTANTARVVPAVKGLQTIDVISGAEGERAGLMTNEFLTLNSLLALAGVKFAQK